MKLINLIQLAKLDGNLLFNLLKKIGMWLKNMLEIIKDIKLSWRLFMIMNKVNSKLKSSCISYKIRPILKKD